jgi:hypothetical protein
MTNSLSTLIIGLKNSKPSWNYSSIGIHKENIFEKEN